MQQKSLIEKYKDKKRKEKQFIEEKKRKDKHGIRKYGIATKTA
jgi:hypothetical protein